MKFFLSLLALLYALSPYDLFPDFIIGWGWIDDLIILGLLWYFFVNRRKRVSYESYYERRGDPQNPYTVLGIGRNASTEDIKKAYRQLANKYHPDKVNHLGQEFRELAGTRFNEIQNAYQELMAKARDPKPRFHK